MRIATLVRLTAVLCALTAVLFSQGRDYPAEVDSARQGLRGAYSQLQHAGGDWGGHRASAMNHIQEAIKELDEAEKWAREHHDIR
jgi:hypothetical protein